MKKKHLLLLLAAALFFWAAGQMRAVLPSSRARSEASEWAQAEGTGARERKDTTLATRPGTNPPFVVLGTVALGGFRGLVVDMLWMRLITLQSEGKVFEIAQLADWITKLEPHFTSVWAFHAWNMAYNISILYANPEHRWLWVRNGIELLRDNGLPCNPADPVLYRELGWIYQHKIGQAWDDMHAYYRYKLAKEMDDLFHGPRPNQTPTATGAEKIKKMRAEYKLFPETMRSIEQEYGELDWRLPETHALYWAYRGVHSAAAGSDTAPCRHMLCQSMAAEFMSGRLSMDAEAGRYLTTPRLDLLPGAIKAYEDALRHERADYFKAAYINFLSEAAFVFHVYGDDHATRELFDKMLAAEPQMKKQMSFEKYLRACDQFDIAGLPMADAVAWIEGTLYQSYARARGARAKNPAELLDKARRLWKQYKDNPQNRKATEIIPDFELIDQQARQRAAGRQPAEK